MPVYEYQCAACLKRFSVLVGMVSGDEAIRCPHCGGKEASRLMSSFSRLRTEDDRLDDLAGEVEGLGEPESPTQMREIMREMGKATDEDCSDEMEEVFEADMAGESDE